jgi:hypothetical protein
MNNLSEFSDFSLFLGYTIKSVYRKFYEEIDKNDANLRSEERRVGKECSL